MIEAAGLVDLAERVRPWAKMDSRLHGPEHWARVAACGAALAEAMGLEAGARRGVQIFAWTHDLARVTDGNDPEHGLRGARLFRELAPGLFPRLGERERTWIEAAIRLHNKGMTAARAVDTGSTGLPHEPRRPLIAFVGCCWDADRLDLLRLGMMPRPDRMSTDHWETVLPRALEAHGYR